MKLYTKTGDKGTSGLFGGERLPKSHPLFDLIGTIDELNAHLGEILLLVKDYQDIKEVLLRVQADLFVLGSMVATPKESKYYDKIPQLKKSKVQELEKEIDNWVENTPELKNFILPGGSKASAKLFIARSVCRRAERLVYADKIDSLSNPEVISSYLNRLSDWLFALARYTNKLSDCDEIIWKS